MACIEYLAECISQEFVYDGLSAKTQQLISNGEVAVQVALGISDEHRWGFSDTVPYEILLQTIYIAAAQGENGREKLIFMDDAFIEMKSNSV